MIAIVTGASSGMGREFVKQIAGLGIVQEIWAVARRKDRLTELESEVDILLKSFACDLTKEQDVTILKDALARQKPHVHMLVNCAGFAKFGAYDEVRAQDALAMIDLNIRSLVETTQATIPYMQQGSHIVQIASTAAFQPLPEMNVYAASKAFVYSYSRALNKELQLKGITVTTVCPGWTKTEFFDVGKKDASNTAVHNFPFQSSPENVVKKALKDALRERELSIFGIINKGHFFFSKILPDSFIMRMWDIMR